MDDLFDDFDDDEFDGNGFDEDDYFDDDGTEDYDSDGDELDEFSLKDDVDSGEKAFNEEIQNPLWDGPRWQDWMIIGPLSEDMAKENRKELKYLRKANKNEPQ
jgi:hypothetical protein